MSTEMTPGVERKLRLIHDLIESKQFKKALKQCNTSLKKSDNLMLLTMKSFVLQKLGEEQESLAVIEDVISHNPTNQTLLDLITIVLKSLNRYDRLNQLYAEAFKRNPTRESGESLFNSYASNFNYDEQYKIAFQLYKTFNDLKYCILAVESICLIAMHDPSQVKLLNLATLFFGKIKQNKGLIPTAELVELELIIETLKGKDLEVLRILQESREVLSDAIIREAEVHQKLKNNIKALSLVKEIMIKEEVTPNLTVFTKYVDIVIAGIQGSVDIQAHELQCKDLVEEILEEGKTAVIIAYSVLSTLSKSPSSRNFRRTCQLAIFHLFACLIEKNYLYNYTELILPKVQEYIRDYCDIPSVIEDLKNVLSILTDDEVGKLMESIQDFNMPDVTEIKDLCKVLAYVKLAYKFAKPLDLSILLSLYKKSLTLEAAPKKGEHRLGDILMMIVSKHFTSTHYVPQVLLEHAIPQSPYNYFLKLQLINNYSKTEFTKKIIEVYESLDIKSVQHESLGYLVFGELNDWRLWKADLSKMSNSSEKFHRYYAIDLAESTNLAYQHHHVAQVQDFAKFKHKVDSSLYFHMTQISSIYMELAKKLQEGSYKMNTDFIHKDLSEFTETFDTNVLNDYLKIKEKPNTKQIFGRWSNMPVFDFERLAIAFICEHSTESTKTQTTLQKMQKVFSEMQNVNSFYIECYKGILDTMSVLCVLKAGDLENGTKLMSNSLETMERLKKLASEFELFQRFKNGQEFVYECFMDDLKKIAFSANCFEPIIAMVLNFLKGMVPQPKSSKKGKKTAVDVFSVYKGVIARVIEMSENFLQLLQNEDFLRYIDSDSKIHREIEQIPLDEVNKAEKIAETIQARRGLIKEICVEIHSIKSSSSTLFR